jgi:holo-[acyl-carrier protein] synthase
MIIGVGTDILKIDRIEKLLDKYDTILVERILHPEEKLKLASVAENKKTSYIAKRFAAKEAVSKALGEGIGRIAFKDILISNLPSGKPLVEIDFLKFNIPNYKIEISIADDYPMVVAFAVAYTTLNLQGVYSANLNN